MTVALRPRLAWSRIFAISLLLHISLAPLQHVAAVKRTMPMIGMDEDGEESDDDTPATTQPRNALRTMVNSFLTPSAPNQFKALSPIDREYARQAQFPGADQSDLNGGDDAGSKGARTPNVLGSGGQAAVMSYHGGKIVTTSLQVYLIMCGPVYSLAHHCLELRTATWMPIVASDWWPGLSACADVSRLQPHMPASDIAIPNKCGGAWQRAIFRGDFVNDISWGSPMHARTCTWYCNVMLNATGSAGMATGSHSQRWLASWQSSSTA